MAKKTIAHEVKYQIIVSETELEMLRVGLRLVRDFGLVEDWDLAQEILSDLSKEH
ncbi:hypothetical protein ACFWNC_14795 [Streptomyces sp. NPDC058369]|uniref:hypothetical protein n=1 Tax=Streptomyces sp. NPDC058369 TaxID=3346462 RepID=UPI00364F152E